MELSEKTTAYIDKLIARYPQKRSALLMVLYAIQEEKGYVADESHPWIAERLEIEPIQVYEVVTFYPMFLREPPAKRQIRVCRTLSCALAGCYKTREILEKELGIDAETERSADGEFQIEFVECLANCHIAPAVQVDETDYAIVTPDTAEAFAQKLREEAGLPTTAAAASAE
ncbi:MAG: NAD(P)H-dependent oxidoreductase subunit E [Opitutales bacterium]